MRTLRALIVDDDERNVEPIQQGLDLELEALGWSADWKIEPSSVSARRCIRDSPPFDFAIVDLFLNENDVQDGIEVLKDLNNKDSRTYCLLVTSYSNEAPGFRDAAVPYCTFAIDRMEIHRAPRWKLDRIATDIIEHLAGNGVLETVRTSYDATDRSVVSLLNQVGRAVVDTRQDDEDTSDDDSIQLAGERVIRNLAVRCLGETSSAGIELEIDYVAPGRSGTHVCRIDFRKADDPHQSFILKFGFDKGALERECRANREAAKALGEQSLVRLGSDVKTDAASGYHGITARVTPDAVTLRDWLERPTSEQHSGAVADVLLGKLLAPLFATENQRTVDTAKWLTPSSSQVVRAKATIDRYSAAIEDSRAVGARSAARELRPLMHYLGTGEYPAQAKLGLPQTVIYVRTFGDLHSGNILMQAGPLPRPVLVDAALYRRGHWAADSARLIVDLLLRAWRPGVEAMIWSNIPESVHFGMRLCPLSHGGWSGHVNAVERFISECTVNLVAYISPQDAGLTLEDWHWQWHTTLAKEFLRQAGHDDLPPPRAVLALILAARHMRVSVLCLKRAHPAKA